MEPIITPRVVVPGGALFTGICLPLLFAHYSREPESRLADRVVVVLAFALFALPVYRYASARSAAGGVTVPDSHALIYEVSPGLVAWMVEPIFSLLGGALLGSFGFVFYEVLRSRTEVRTPGGLENGR